MTVHRHGKIEACHQSYIRAGSTSVTIDSKLANGCWEITFLPQLFNQDKQVVSKGIVASDTLTINQYQCTLFINLL